MSQFDSMFSILGGPVLAARLGRAVVRRPRGGVDVAIPDAIVSEDIPAESDEADGPIVVRRKTIKASSSYFATGGAAQAGERWTIDGEDWDFDTQMPHNLHCGMVTLGVVRFAPVNKTRQGRETHSG